ncbi:rhomboid family intramembrane serine protease [Roseiconus lacunae]|uniref:Rhomboid family intramembrane serine protease n=1 Tax=Roseiconus lacunae TaxID=2605694 RepID=A0ABT7PCE3_9BACT|nr:rhomboid family intramembrane serine protease [Roseiconus lacunae]MCD0462409.1 rhomboid family intramembrane serine protease [Roseiconus lacunae]MDM4014160.1 rhomboid family intramembrane serine protease [Roseiconus lacunae]WRQ53456.1 rhomboid family intramembrane serine protease [Stieleria sp. HD01]
MGLYERDYGRDDEMSPWERHQRSQQPKSMAIIVLAVTCGAWVLDILTTKNVDGTRVSVMAEWFACYGTSLIQPWYWYQFLSYGFVHDIERPFHILFNMFNLFFFGRAIEMRLGRWEFLRFYLVSVVFAGALGALTYWVAGDPSGRFIGASGAVSALLILFVCFDPHADLNWFGIVQIKAMWIVVAFLVWNVYGSLQMLSGPNRMGGGTAFTVHLAGAAFAYLYHAKRWNLAWLDPSRFQQSFGTSVRRSRLKIHDPDSKLRKEEEEVDKILAKIHASGEESLTRAERRILERHSRRQREMRNQK